MTQLYVQPARSAEATANIQVSLNQKIDLANLQQLNSAERERVIRALGAEPFHLWAPRPTDGNANAWQHMEPGDAVLFYVGGTTVLRLFLVTGTVESAELGNAVWGPTNDGQIFRHLYALGDELPSELTLADYNSTLGYAENNVIMGFRGLTPEQSSLLAAEFPEEISGDLLDDLAHAEEELAHVPETERKQLQKSRIGQGQFRSALIEQWKGCAISGVGQLDLLRASHIKPWRVSSNEERLDRFNGLLLLPHYDHLFDQGYISFDNGGAVIISAALPESARKEMGITEDLLLEPLYQQHRPYLAYHREHVLK